MRRLPSFISSPPRAVVEALGVMLGFALVTVLVTWPQASVLTTQTHGHHDALFSMWRLSWIAHALSTDPSSLFDPPIFWPVKGTLAFSDAVLLQGLIAWPFLAADVPVLPVYNVLLLAGPWMSAVGAYLLTRSLTQSRAAAAVAGLAFGFAPYRIEHAMHLELQWAQWMPLTLWALHRTWRDGRVSDGVLTGFFILLQFLSCIYYGIFLVLFLTLVVPVLYLRQRPSSVAKVALALAVGAVVIAPALIAYALPYRQSQAQLGGRGPEEIAQYSARLPYYLSSPPENRLYGDLTAHLGGAEGRLFPGAIVIVLALVALWRPSRHVVTYVWGLLCAMLLSLGTHTPAYAVLLALVRPLEGLRAPARFAMLATLAIAVLAGFGMTALRRPGSALAARGRGAVAAVTLLVLMVMTGEYASEFGPLHPWPRRAPMYANWLASQPPGGVVDFPAPVGHALPLYEPEWSYLGTFHRRPLVNGYSGYYPRPYLDLLGALDGFPSSESLWILDRRGVRYVVLHEDRYPADEFLALIGRIERYDCLERVGRFPDPAYPVSLYELDPQCLKG